MPVNTGRQPTSTVLQGGRERQRVVRLLCGGSVSWTACLHPSPPVWRGWSLWGVRGCEEARAVVGGSCSVSLSFKSKVALVQVVGEARVFDRAGGVSGLQLVIRLRAFQTDAESLNYWWEFLRLQSFSPAYSLAEPVFRLSRPVPVRTSERLLLAIWNIALIWPYCDFINCSTPKTCGAMISQQSEGFWVRSLMSTAHQ